MMDIKDLFLTPIYLFAFIVATLIYIQFKRKDKLIRKYFLKGLLMRFVGSIGFCLIYEFYYGYGDTFVYFKNSLVSLELLMAHPIDGFYYLFVDDTYMTSDVISYALRITNRFDSASFFAVKLAAVFNFFTFDTYLLTSLLFAIVGFSGSWKLFRTLTDMYPNYEKQMAICCLFFPSIIFWGSGLMKDTICVSALGWAFWGINNIILKKKKIVANSAIVFYCFYVIYIVKIYILLCFVPAAILYAFTHFNLSVKNVSVKIFLRPILLLIALVVGLYAAFKITEDDTRYNVNSIAETAQITGAYIKSESKLGGGSFYDLGEVNFDASSLARLIPMGIIVTLFRPFIWEVRNPVMLLSAIESVFLLFISLKMLFKWKMSLFTKINSDPYLVMAIFFSLTFAFAVGISTNNFGTLVRYKLPMMPFYISFIYILLGDKKDK